MYLDSNLKSECCGCEACVQICGKNAVSIYEDEEGFWYPRIDANKCVQCNRCRDVCPVSNTPAKHDFEQFAFGGYHKDPSIRFESTSGGAFSAIVDTFCDSNYVVFGAVSEGLTVFHTYIEDKELIAKFRKSKYSQSVIGDSYQKAKQFLVSGKKVLFSGTPCQIAGLLNYLKNTNTDNLLTVEVVCEGVPSPLYIRKLDSVISEKCGSPISELDYRCKGKSIRFPKWDFEIMRIKPEKSKKSLYKDRWFNPFWSIWLQHLMSRPSCYDCRFTSQNRVADFTLGDLWGVHIYCPELYGKNGGSSLVVCNTTKGQLLFSKVQKLMLGHELNINDAIKYQGPMRKSIDNSPDRSTFMEDLKSEMSLYEINRKWAKKPSVKLLFQKYIWGNRQKVFVWNIRHRSNHSE